MHASKELIKYPENLVLAEALKQTGISYKHIAKRINVSRVYLSRVLNGKDKGGQIIGKLKEIAELTQ